jgi:hypothetical protein
MTVGNFVDAPPSSDPLLFVSIFRGGGLLNVLEKCLMGAAAKMLLELNDADAAKCARIGERNEAASWTRFDCLCGTTETPVPAATMARMVVNWPLSKTTFGSRRARPQAESVLSRKQ